MIVWRVVWERVSVPPGRGKAPSSIPKYLCHPDRSRSASDGEVEGPAFTAARETSFSRLQRQHRSMPNVQHMNRLIDYDEQNSIHAPIARPEKQLTDWLAK